MTNYGLKLPARDIHMDIPPLVCPSCKETYLHHGGVISIVRDIEDGPGTRVEHDAGVTIKRVEDADIMGRRDVVFIKFWCETCSTHPQLVIQQHKGQTFLAWMG